MHLACRPAAQAPVCPGHAGFSERAPRARDGWLSGIGRAIALRLGADGAAVAVNYIGDRDAAEETVRKIGATAVAVAGDVADEAAVREMYASAEQGLGGPVDLLVNNAGVEAPFELHDMPLEEWQRVLSVNLTGPFLCSRELVRRLPDDVRPAAIVNVSSVHEVIPWPSFSHYGGMTLYPRFV